LVLITRKKGVKDDCRMVLRRIFILLMGSSLLLTNCATPVAQRERQAISKGVYATKDSIDVSRYDLAKSYINETTRLVPPPDPKDRIKIPPFKTGQKGEPEIQYVVLPPNEQQKHIIVLNSPEYNQILEANKQLQASEKKAQDTLEQVKKANDKIIKDQAEELARLRARPNIFVRTWHFLTGLFKWGPIGIIVLSIAAVIVAVLVPGLAPFIWAAFRMLGALLGMALGLLTKLILWIAGLLKKKA